MGIITHFHLGTTLDPEDMWAAQDELDACLSTALPNRYIVKAHEGRYTSRISVVTFDFLDLDVESEIRTLLARHGRCCLSMSYD